MARDRTTLSYLLDTQFEFCISGRWSKGGLLEIYYDGQFVEHVKLARVGWALLTTLARQAKSSHEGSQLRAFMTADEILDDLRKRKVLQSADPERVVRLIFELRKKLDRAKARKFQKAWHQGPRDWGKRVIETHQLGYRLSLDPKNIHIEMLGPGSSVPPPKSPSITGVAGDRRLASLLTFADGSERAPFDIGVRR